MTSDFESASSEGDRDQPPSKENGEYQGRWLECYVIELSNDDLRIPLPYPFTETVWIEKRSFKIRKTVENYITSLQQGGRAPITYPATRTYVYPECR